MRKILAIALLAVRTAIRSRLFISLIVILFTIIIGLPMTIKGDGTLTGQVKILLYYTLGLMTVVLGIATLWTSCSAISQEIEDKQIHLVAVKPVYRFQVWLGKWLGLLVINAALLCFAGTVTYALLCWNINSSNATEQDRRVLHEEILVGRRLLRPRPELVEKEVRERFSQLLKEGKIPGDVPEETAFLIIKKRLLTEKSVVAPGQSKQWIFELDGTTAPLSKKSKHGYKDKPDYPILVRFRFSSPGRDRQPVSGVWSVGTEQKLDIFQFTFLNYLAGAHQFSIPLSVIPSREQLLVIKYKNSERECSNTAIFDPEMGVELLIRESGFEINLVRALLIILCHLALLAALGLTAGTLFSFPVATFAASSVLVISIMIHYFAFLSPQCTHECHHYHGMEPEPSVLQTSCEKIIERLSIIVEPAMQLDPIKPLSDGLLVSWSFAGKAVLLLAGIYPGVLGMIGGYFFKRRELALPG